MTSPSTPYSDDNRNTIESTLSSPSPPPPSKPAPSFSPGIPLPTAASTTSPPSLFEPQPQPPLTLPLRSRTSSVGVGATSQTTRSGSTTPTRSTTRGRIPGRISHSANVSRSSTRTQSPLSRAQLSAASASDAANDDIRSLIIRGFSPVIGVYTSPDTDELVKAKGFRRGLRELLQPFGETIPGKLVIRDSSGSSRTWEDYAVRFADLPSPRRRTRGTSVSLISPTSSPKTFSFPSLAHTRSGSQSPIPPLTLLEQLLDKHIQSTANEGQDIAAQWTDDAHAPPNTTPSPFASPLYKLFLRRLLAANTPLPHETFAHPVACVIAISSRTPSPLETLRSLYAHTANGEKKPPPWMHPDYLRYYVLLHDEDRDDIAASTAVFDQMKRHFGLHCHLLRVRSTQCVVTDDDAVPVSTPEFLSPLEDMQRFEEAASLLDLGEPISAAQGHLHFLPESDVTALRAFVRELVAQSVIPHMEKMVAIWNDQVASKRRGISGRFMSLGRRWAGFGSSSRSSSISSSSGAGGGGAGAGGGFDSRGSFYAYDSSEAILRKLADYAFMLRDYKLASQTYELVRSDFSHDKAWRYQAGAHEMCAVSTLLNPLANLGATASGVGDKESKAKLEGIDTLLDTACYSYLTRCSDSQATLRTFLLGVELLKSRGGAAAENGAKWAVRTLDMGLLASIQRTLVFERVAACYASKTPWAGGGGNLGTGTGVGKEGDRDKDGGRTTPRLGLRKRKAGMWIVLAAEAWWKLGRADLAGACLREGERLYAGTPLAPDGGLVMPECQAFVEELKGRIEEGLGGGGGDNEGLSEETQVDLQGLEEVDVRS